MPRIVHVFKDYFPPTHGGIEKHIHDVVHSLQDFEFAVLTSSRSTKRRVDQDGAVRVVRVPEYARPVSTPITPAWRRLIKESGADLFHFHMPNPFGELVFATAGSEVPMVATYHSDIIGRRALLPLFKPFQKRFLSLASKIVVSSAPLAKSAPPLREHQSKVAVIPFGVDVEWLHQRPPEADEIRLRNQGPLLLFVGRLVYYKGIDILVRAMKGIDATCLIVGEGPLRAEIERGIANVGLEDRVILLGEVSDETKRAYMHASDLFILPSTSRAEAFGISMLEAMSCGKPAVSTELGTGTSWLNQHNRTGLVVPPNDPSVLSAAIKTILSDDSKRARMGELAADRARTHFTREQMLTSMAALYRSVL